MKPILTIPSGRRFYIAAGLAAGALAAAVAVIILPGITGGGNVDAERNRRAVGAAAGHGSASPGGTRRTQAIAEFDALAARLLAAAGADESPEAAARRLELIEALADMARSDPERVFALLQRCESIEQKLLLGRVLAHMGTTQAMELLMRAALEEKNGTAREALASAIGEASTREAHLAAASALAATNDPILLAAIRDLISRQANAETVEFLAELARETEAVPGQRHNIQEAVAAIRQEEAVAALGILAAKNPDPLLAQAAASSLAKIGNAEAIQALAHGFHHASSSEMAQQFLAHLGTLSNPEGAQMIASLLENATDAEFYGRLEQAWSQITGQQWMPGQISLPVSEKPVGDS